VADHALKTASRALIAGNFAIGLLWYAVGHAVSALMPSHGSLLPVRGLSVLGAALSLVSAIAVWRAVPDALRATPLSLASWLEPVAVAAQRPWHCGGSL